MSLIELSCVNCSAPLQIGDDLESFACSYCGTTQVVQRSGGVVVLRKVQAAIHAVQRGTDRTAAELAIPRLNKELAEVQAVRANSVKLAKEKMTSARKGRSNLTALVAGALLILWVWGMASLPANINGWVLKAIGWGGLAAIVAVSTFVFQTIKLPKDSTPDVLARYDALIAKIEAQIAANRAILDA